jgi:hypothetical protein
MTEHTIGASDIAGILGLSPWQTPAQVWARMRGLTPPSESNAMRRGQTLELGILIEYAERNDLSFYPRWWPNERHIRRQTAPHRPGLYRGPPYSDDGKTRIHHPTVDWMTCRPDAYEIETWRGITRLVEVKTTRSFADWQTADGTPILPPAYFVQVQWQMMVTNVNETVVEAFCTMDDSRRSITVRKAENIQLQLMAKVSDWRERHLVGDEIPDGMTAEIVGLVFPKPREPETWLDPDDDTILLVAEYAEASAAETAAAKRKEAARDSLCSVILDYTGIRGLCTFKATKRGRQFRLLKGGNDE